MQHRGAADLRHAGDSQAVEHDAPESAGSEVFAVAKRDLRPGDTLDGIGGCTFYSLIDTYEAARTEGLLPIGLAKGAHVVRPVRMDAPITFADVKVAPSTVSSLHRLQEQWFEGTVSEADLLAAVDALGTE